ncbi:hypothetical protein [Bacillus sp. FJAT-47783]|uniref:YkvI family membrane protein n=1 Tax=Bacillus sp. FJAT-47783 TaxID=2922712 RepID=UPI001FAC803D|nr:hypothetical protein [Bacillus sp. FJAT-47783]
MRKNLFVAFQVAAIYIGTVVGAGFATGREIVEFFTKYGEAGLLGIIICTWLLSWLGMKMMIVGHRIGAKSYQQLNHFLFGSFFGPVFNMLMLMTLIGVTSVMLSGAGAIFKEQLHMSAQFGIVLTILLTMVVLLFGITGISSVNVVVVPIFILFSLFLSYQTLDVSTISLEFIARPSLSSIFSSFLYASFNLALAQAVLVPLASQIQDEEAIKVGAKLGGVGLGIILCTSHLALSSLPNVEMYDIPMAELIKGSMVGFYYLYLLVMYGEVFTSVIGNVYGIERQIKATFQFPSISIVTVLLCITYFISLVGYSDLITKLYPLFGYMSVGFLLLLALKKVPK